MTIIRESTQQRLDTTDGDMEHKRLMLTKALGSERRYAILLLMLARKTQREIAEAVGISQQHVYREICVINKVLKDLGQSVA